MTTSQILPGNAVMRLIMMQRVILDAQAEVSPGTSLSRLLNRLQTDLDQVMEIITTANADTTAGQGIGVHKTSAYTIHQELIAAQAKAPYEAPKLLAIPGPQLLAISGPPTSGTNGTFTNAVSADATAGHGISVEQAKTFRDIWHAVYPEMRQFFDWVNTQKDASQADLAAWLAAHPDQCPTSYPGPGATPPKE